MLEAFHLTAMYPNAKAYTRKVAQVTERLIKEVWLTESDGRKIESELSAVPTH